MQAFLLDTRKRTLEHVIDCSRSTQSVEYFVEGGKPENLEKTQPTYIYVAGCKKGKRATFVGGERSHSTVSAPYLSFRETAVEAQKRPQFMETA